MKSSIGEYSIRDGYSQGHQHIQMQTGIFLSERRCPECGAKMNTHGDGRFLCFKCNFADVKDVSKLQASDIDYPIPNSKKTEAIRHGLGIWD